MLSRILKIATILSFLMVVVPESNQSFYVWMMPVMMLYELDSGEYLLFGTGVIILISIGILLYSAIRKQPKKNDHIWVLLATGVQLIIVVSFLSAIRKYGGRMESLLFLNFLCWSVLTSSISIRAHLYKKRKQSGQH